MRGRGIFFDNDRKLFFYPGKNLLLKLTLMNDNVQLSSSDSKALETQFPHQSLALFSWNHFTGGIQIIGIWLILNLILFIRLETISILF